MTQGPAAAIVRAIRESPLMTASGSTRSSAEFIALVALTFSLIAMSVDSMLPALGDIAKDLGAGDPNDRQLVLTAFFAGLTVGQFIYGPISDSTGRKPAMYAGIGCFIAGGLICGLTHDFTTMILGRILQGFGAAGPRIVAVAMVRDLYAGRAMARIMSFVMAVFILVPILAPSIGQLMLLIADWRFIFYGLVVVGIIDFLWIATPPARDAGAREPCASVAWPRCFGRRARRHATGSRSAILWRSASSSARSSAISAPRSRSSRSSMARASCSPSTSAYWPSGIGHCFHRQCQAGDALRHAQTVEIGASIGLRPVARLLALPPGCWTVIRRSGPSSLT